ncbi:MBL fold metallo-hydrolase [Paenibacillus sp. KN14-4R]|uniref:MBL fold metallo-hydrolase n=1 Tax=Paenibacillus sp. KN14-4R TaxID=3445773 RepID=UPI003F9F4BC5
MQIRLIRNATLWVQYAGVQFLIDPMFSDKGANPPIPNSSNTRRNPLVELPIPIDELIQPDAVIVTHLHRDHWDEAAAAAIGKQVPIFCQPDEDERIRSHGFSSVTPVSSRVDYKGVTLIRTSGQHGTGVIRKLMGRVSGFIFKADGHPTLYLAGDTIWCEDVKQVLDAHRPDVTVVNSGGAHFAVGDPITMDADDVVRTSRYAPCTKVIAVHMDAINHCFVTREVLRDRLSAESLLEQVTIPLDGEWC